MRNFMLLILLLLGLSANLGAQTQYYQGKTVRFIVGYPAGSTHDLWARLVASYMTKYIPGNPNIIVQDMPGAGSADVDLAAERGEIQCRAISVPVYFGREPYHTWRKTGFARVLFQMGKKRDPRIADVPTLNELMDQYQTPAPARRLANVVAGTAEFQ